MATAAENEKYRQDIDALIPLAVKNTKKMLNAARAEGGLKPLPECRTFSMVPNWDKTFHAEMNRLAREAGLRNI